VPSGFLPMERARMLVCMEGWMHACMHLHICVYVHVHMYICI
jgi:hypothetical protein